MTNILLSDNEITYLVLSLKRYEAQLLDVDEDEVGDSVNDLLIVQALREKLQSAKQAG